MTRIDSVADRPDRAGRYLVRFSDGKTMRLYRQTVEDFGLYSGRELTEDELSALTESAGQTSAKMRAVRIVSASSVSARDLEQRLIRKGEQEDQAREAVRWMQELDLVDDAETAKNIVSRCAARGYGVNRAKQMLYEKQIPREYWEDALADFPDQTEGILEFLRSRLPADADDKAVKRAVDALVRRGHGWTEIRQALKQLQMEVLEDQYG